MKIKRTLIFKVTKIIIFLIIICFSIKFANFITYAPLSHNPQGEFCETHASRMNLEQMTENYNFFDQKNQRVFIEVDGKYIIYNPLLHKDQKTFFVEHRGDDIQLSNSKTLSDDNPCTLTKTFYIWYFSLFVVSFLILYLIFFPIIYFLNKIVIKS